MVNAVPKTENCSDIRSRKLISLLSWFTLQLSGVVLVQDLILRLVVPWCREKDEQMGKGQNRKAYYIHHQFRIYWLLVY
jgi:hypothetical protein